MSKLAQVGSASGIPLATQVRVSLTDAIRNREFAAGARLPTIRTLAAKYGVGVCTVAKAFEELQAEGLITSRRRRGSFVCHTSVPMSQRRIFVCMHRAYLHKETGTWRAYERLRGIIGAAEALGVHTTLVTEGEKFRPPADPKGRFGVVFMDPNYVVDGLGNVAEHVAQRDIPCCVLTAYQAQFPNVQVERVRGFELSVNHLLHLGHQRIALINTPVAGDTVLIDGNTSISEAIRQGFEAAFSRAGITSNPDLYIEAAMPEKEGPAPTVQAVEWLLSRRVPPTAIVCNNDARALLVMEAIKTRGLRVPQDISVVGYDNMPEGEHSAPPLTTVDALFYEQGRAAVEYVLNRIEGKEVAWPSVSPRLVVRESSAAVRPSDE